MEVAPSSTSLSGPLYRASSLCSTQRFVCLGVKPRSPGPPPAESDPDSSSSLVCPGSGPQSSAQHRGVRELPALPRDLQPGGDLQGWARAAGLPIPGVSAAPFLVCFSCGARKETLTFMVFCTALSCSLSQRDSQLCPDRQRAGAAQVLLAVCLPFPVGQTKLLAACFISVSCSGIILKLCHLRKDQLSNYTGKCPFRKAECWCKLTKVSKKQLNSVTKPKMLRNSVL